MDDMFKERRALIIDDEEPIRHLLRTHFEWARWHVDEAPDAVQGIDKVVNAKAPFTAIVVDVRMPGPSGVDFLRALREATLDKGTVIAVITGRASDDEEARLRILKPHIVYRKPFHPDDLLREIVKHMIGSSEIPVQ